jgi:phosphatidylserine decarboxylase
MNLLLKLLQMLVLRISRIKARPIKTLLIKYFKSHYQINLDEYARKHIDEYSSFNDFFTREFAKGVRLIDQSNDALVSPVDGKIMESGTIESGQLFQLKNMKYSLDKLLNKDIDLIEMFQNAYYITIYLAPNNYHRVHLPYHGKLVNNQIVKGKNYKVNEHALRQVSGLYTKNIRQISQFEDSNISFCMIMVGAMNVSSISLTDKNGCEYKKGEEFSRFNLGSTVLILFPQSAKIKWSHLITFGQTIKLGECIAKFR